MRSGKWMAGVALCGLFSLAVSSVAQACDGAGGAASSAARPAGQVVARQVDGVYPLAGPRTVAGYPVGNVGSGSMTVYEPATRAAYDPLTAPVGARQVDGVYRVGGPRTVAGYPVGNVESVPMTVYYPAGSLNVSSARPAGTYYGTGAPYQTLRPVFPISSSPASVYYGRGVLGQPKLYVSGQPLRNVLRYLTP